MLLELGPVLIGASRKSVIGRVLNQQNAEDRLIGSLRWSPPVMHEESGHSVFMMQVKPT